MIIFQRVARSSTIQRARIRRAANAALALVFLLAFQARRGTAESFVAQSFSVSLPPLAIGEQEEVYSFACETRLATIDSWSWVPPNWNISLENGEAERSKASGQVIVGVGINRSDNFFDSFMSITKLPPSIPGGHSSFDIGCTLGVYRGDPDDAKNFRRVKFSRKEIILKRVTRGTFGPPG